MHVPSYHLCLAMSPWNNGIEPRTFIWLPHEAACDISRCHLDWVIWGSYLDVCPEFTVYTFGVNMYVCIILFKFQKEGAQL